MGISIVAVGFQGIFSWSTEPWKTFVHLSFSLSLLYGNRAGFTPDSRIVFSIITAALFPHLFRETGFFPFIWRCFTAAIHSRQEQPQPSPIMLGKLRTLGELCVRITAVILAQTRVLSSRLRPPPLFYPAWPRNLRLLLVHRRKHHRSRCHRASRRWRRRRLPVDRSSPTALYPRRMSLLHRF